MYCAILGTEIQFGGRGQGQPRFHALDLNIDHDYEFHLALMKLWKNTRDDPQCAAALSAISPNLDALWIEETDQCMPMFLRDAITRTQSPAAWIAESFKAFTNRPALGTPLHATSAHCNLLKHDLFHHDGYAWLTFGQVQLVHETPPCNMQCVFLDETMCTQAQDMRVIVVVVVTVAAVHMSGWASIHVVCARPAWPHPPQFLCWYLRGQSQRNRHF